MIPLWINRSELRNFFFWDYIASIGNQISAFQRQRCALTFKGQNFQEEGGHYIVSKCLDLLTC